MSNLAAIKKGDTVILHMFTGIAVGVKEVLAADKATFTIETRIGKAKFSRKTGKQVEPEAKSPKYANYATEDDGSFVPKSEQKKAKKKVAKAAETKKVSKKPVEVEEDDEDEDEEEVVASVKKKKAAPAAPAPAVKAKKKKVVEEDDEDFEEMD